MIDIVKLQYFIETAKKQRGIWSDGLKSQAHYPKRSPFSFGSLEAYQDYEYKRLCEEDYERAVKELTALLSTLNKDESTDEERKNAIKQFFAARNKRIIKTGLDYTQNNVNSVNKAYVGLAKLAAEITDINYIKLLMPNLTTIPDGFNVETVGTMVRWQDESITSYILSDDGTYLLPIQFVLRQDLPDCPTTPWQPWCYDAHDGATVRLLTPSEIARARAHSPEAETMYQSSQQKERDDSGLGLRKRLRKVLEKLEHDLRAHGVRGTLGATELSAAEGINLIIATFTIFLQDLERNDRNMYTRLMDSYIEARGRRTFREEIIGGIRRGACVDMLSNTLHTFLHNPENNQLVGDDLYQKHCAAFKTRYDYANIESLVVNMSTGVAAIDVNIPKPVKVYFLVLETLKKLIRFIIRLPGRLLRSLGILLILLGRLLRLPIMLLRLLIIGIILLPVILFILLWNIPGLLAVVSVVGNIALSIYTIILAILTPGAVGWGLFELLELGLYACLGSIVLTITGLQSYNRVALLLANLIFLAHGLLVLLCFNSALVGLIISKVASIVWMSLTKLIVSGFGMLGLTLTSIGFPIITGIISIAVILALLDATFARNSFQRLIYVISNIFLTLCSSAAIVTSYITAGIALKAFLLIMSAPTVVATATMITLIASASLLMCGAAVLSSVVVFVDMLSPLDQSNNAVRLVISVCEAINIMGLFTGPFALAALFEQGTALFITLGQLILGSSTALQLGTFSVFAVGYAVPCLAVIALGFAGKKLLDSYAPDALPSVQHHVGQTWNAVTGAADEIESRIYRLIRRH